MQRRWQDWRDMVAANSAGDHLRAEEALSAYQRDSQAIPGIGVGTLSQETDGAEAGDPSVSKSNAAQDPTGAPLASAAAGATAEGNTQSGPSEHRTAASGTDRRLEAVIASYELN